LGKKVHLRHLSSDCQKLLENDKNHWCQYIEDPSYKVAVDKV
jgi:SulP family sulfate permease